MSHSATIPAAAGIDVGKHFLDLGFFPAAKPMRQDNTGPASPSWSRRQQRGIRTVALEAIGPYAYPLITALRKAQARRRPGDPRQVRRSAPPKG